MYPRCFAAQKKKRKKEEKKQETIFALHYTHIFCHGEKKEGAASAFASFCSCSLHVDMNQFLCQKS